MAGRSPLSSIAILGVFGTMAMVLMLLMSLGGVSDPEAGGVASKVHKQLARSLAEDRATTKLTMRLLGTGVDAPREYTLRLQPSAAVTPNAKAVERLLLRAAGIVSGQLDAKAERTTIRCIAIRPEHGDLERTFVRLPGQGGGFELLPAPSNAPDAPDSATPESPKEPATPKQAPPAKPSAKPAGGELK